MMETHNLEARKKIEGGWGIFRNNSIIYHAADEREARQALELRKTVTHLFYYCDDISVIESFLVKAHINKNINDLVLNEMINELRSKYFELKNKN